MMRAPVQYLLPLVLGVVLACTRSDPALEPAPNTPSMLRVENQGFSDMVIYVVNGAQKIRLGIANGNATRTFTLPAQYTGSGPVRFLADPIGSTRTPVSDELVVRPGDIVSLIIPPQ